MVAFVLIYCVPKWLRGPTIVSIVSQTLTFIILIGKYQRNLFSSLFWCTRAEMCTNTIMFNCKLALNSIIVSSSSSGIQWSKTLSLVDCLMRPNTRVTFYYRVQLRFAYNWSAYVKARARFWSRTCRVQGGVESASEQRHANLIWCALCILIPVLFGLMRNKRPYAHHVRIGREQSPESRSGFGVWLRFGYYDDRITRLMPTTPYFSLHVHKMCPVRAKPLNVNA